VLEPGLRVAGEIAILMIEYSFWGDIAWQLYQKAFAAYIYV
jgi:hypothetical protein